MAPLAVLDGVVALVEQSLVRQMPGTDDEPRYRMLETVREFGLERLAPGGEEDDARRRHAEHFLRLSADLVQGPTILMDHASLTRVVAEHDNVRLALAWCDEHGEIDALLQLSSLLYGLWVGRGLYREGVQWVERALERSHRAPSAALVRALDGAGTLAIFQGDYARAASFIDQGWRWPASWVIRVDWRGPGLLRVPVLPPPGVCAGRRAARRGAAHAWGASR